LTFQSRRSSAPIIQEHSTPAIVFDNPYIPSNPPTLVPSKPDESMLSPRYYRSRSSTYTIRINSGMNNLVSFPFSQGPVPRLHSFQPPLTSPLFNT
jgi:hypothetical protein